jgi:hypothetical protein
MNIRQNLEAILAEIEAKKREADDLFRLARTEKEKAEEAKIEAEKAKKLADKAVSELADYKKTQELIDDIGSADQELTKKKVELAERHNKLARWENALVEIETRQSAKEQELKVKEINQAKREADYKEILKKEFFDEIKQKLF